jgi:catechol 2,3-dioxygenase-like lactoylglutathione lyase family enzyme
MIESVDHFALGVDNFEERCRFFTQTLGMELRRRGTRHSTGMQIAMLALPGSDFKIELIETAGDETGFIHLAYRVDDLDAAYQKLVSEGLTTIREPHTLSAAKAKTALLQDKTGLKIQVIEYAPDSPDL